MMLRLKGNILRTLRGPRNQDELLQRQKPGDRVLGIGLRNLVKAENGQLVSEKIAASVAHFYDKDVDSLIALRWPDLTFININDPRHEELFEASLAVYERLFPDSVIQDDPSDIETWLRESNGRPWTELWGVIHFDLNVIGIIYLTCHRGRDFCYGNYFGLLPGPFRRHTRYFLKRELVPYLKKHIRKSKAILFEIEPLDFTFLNGIAKGNSISGNDDEQFLRSERERLRWLYLLNTEENVVTAITPETSYPMPYFHPAMQEPLDETNERPWVLMAYAYGALPERLDLQKAINFLLDDLYSEAYDGKNSYIGHYREYIQHNVKPRILEHAAHASFGDFRIPRDIARLRKSPKPRL